MNACEKKEGTDMKHGIKPTVAQRKLIAGYKPKSEYLNPENWLVIKNLPKELILRHRITRNIIHVPKGGVKDAEHTLKDSEQN